MWMFLIIGIILSGCTKNKVPNLVVAEENMVQDCIYLDTISQISNPGKFVTDYELANYYDGELKVLQQASNMAATHIVWLYNHPIGSSAYAYRCVEWREHKLRD